MAEYTDKPGYSFNPGPPPEVSEYFKHKGLKPSFSWQDVEPQEHAVQFSVAKAMQVDVLQTIKGELQKALDDGIPFDQFQKELEPRLRKLGWWGVKEMRDPKTGEIRKVTLGSPRRLKTIYRANVRSARAAGQWQRIERTKKALPYLVYMIGPSENHRPEHEAKNGLVLPVDDPFWLQWMPPNGWGCKCRVRQITRREAEEIGIEESPQYPMRDITNGRTGEVKSIPVGIDPGWDTNAGIHRQKGMQEFINGKLDDADPAIARAAARDMATSWRVRRIHEGSAHGAAPIAMVPRDLQTALGAQTRVVQFSSDTMAKDQARRSVDDFTKLETVMDRGVVVQRAGPDDLAILHEVDGEYWLAAIKLAADNREIYLTNFYQAVRKDAERLLQTGTIVVR